MIDLIGREIKPPSARALTFSSEARRERQTGWRKPLP